MARGVTGLYVEPGFLVVRLKKKIELPLDGLLWLTGSKAPVQARPFGLDRCPYRCATRTCAKICAITIGMRGFTNTDKDITWIVPFAFACSLHTLAEKSL